MSGATGGPAQAIKEERRSELHEAAGGPPALHGRAAGDAPGV